MIESHARSVDRPRKIRPRLLTMRTFPLVRARVASATWFATSLPVKKSNLSVNKTGVGGDTGLTQHQVTGLEYAAKTQFSVLPR
jgi:hypothetical protein